ncbi:NAD(P)H-hydrate epimerase [Limosilactobacillus fermentum]
MTEQAITAAQMRAKDQFTINQIGIPSLVLMERASLAVRDAILTHYPAANKIVVVAGQGNNGGDGLAIARLLHVAGRGVAILTIGNSAHASSEHQTQAHICDYYQIPVASDPALLKDADLIVDAIFGIGIDRPVEGAYATVIKQVNAAHAPVVAVKADLTVTFAYNKTGLVTDQGQAYAGRVIVADDMGTY